MPPEPEKVTRPVVPVVQLVVWTSTPLEPLVVAVLVPEMVMGPEVLVTAEPTILTPRPALLPDAEPVKEIDPFPVVVDTIPGATKEIPCDAAVVLAPPVPFNVIAPPCVVSRVPFVKEIPWQAPVFPRAVAVIEIV